MEKENSFGKCFNAKPSRSLELEAGEDDEGDDEGNDEGNEGKEEDVDNQEDVS